MILSSQYIQLQINPFKPMFHFYTLPKTWEIDWFSDIFKGDRNETLD